MKTDHYRYLLAERNAIAMFLVALVGLQAILMSRAEQVTEHTPIKRNLFVDSVISRHSNTIADYIIRNSQTIILTMENVTPATVTSFFERAIPYTSQGYRAVFTEYVLHQSSMMERRHVILYTRLLYKTIEYKPEDGLFTVIGMYKVMDASDNKVLMHGSKKFYLNWEINEAGFPALSKYTYENIVKGA